MQCKVFILFTYAYKISKCIIQFMIIDFIMCCFDQGVRCSYIPPLIMLEINVISLVDDLYSWLYTVDMLGQLMIMSHVRIWRPNSVVRGDYVTHVLLGYSIY